MGVRQQMHKNFNLQFYEKIKIACQKYNCCKVGCFYLVDLIDSLIVDSKPICSEQDSTLKGSGFSLSYTKNLYVANFEHEMKILILANK